MKVLYSPRSNWLRRAKGVFHMKHEKKDLSLRVGSNLRRLIKESDCKTQQVFADRFGVSVRNVGRWINGGVKSLDLVEQIASFFDVDPMALLK